MGEDKSKKTDAILKVNGKVHEMLLDLAIGRELISISNTDEADHLGILITRMLVDVGFRWASEDFYKKVTEILELREKKAEYVKINFIKNALDEYQKKRKSVGLK